MDFSFTLADVLAIITLIIGVATFLSMRHDASNKATHARITEVKRDFEADIKAIQENYAQRIELNGAVTSLREMMMLVINESKSASKRIDDVLAMMLKGKNANDG